MRRDFKVGDYVMIKKTCPIFKNTYKCPCDICNTITPDDVALVVGIELNHLSLVWKSGRVINLECDYSKTYLKRISEEKAMVMMI